jgi:glucose-6-phosphate dehydrogenase assembly protein OpcA
MSTLSKERISRLDWAGKNVTLKTVVAEMSRLHDDITREDMSELGHPRSRNCVVNLVITVSDEEREESAEQVVGFLAAGHPLRAIVLHRSPAEQGGLDAEITTEAHKLVRGTSVQREQVTLKVRGEAGEHIASLLEPLLVSDVPTYVWWTGTPSLAETGLREVLGVCDVLIVDSASFTNPVEAFLELAALAQRMSERMGFVDLQWARQKAWRETLAQFFAPAGRQPLLDGLERVVVECAGMGRANRVGAALMSGWLMSSLGWRLTSAASASEKAAEAIVENRNGRMVQLMLRSADAHSLPQGMLCGVRFHGRKGEHPFSMQMEIRADRSDHAHVRIDLGGEETLHQRLPLPQAGEAQLLLHALSAGRRDGVYVRSLAAAAKLVDVLR